MQIHLGSAQHDLYKNESVETSTQNATESYSAIRELVIKYSLGEFSEKRIDYLMHISDLFVLDK